MIGLDTGALDRKIVIQRATVTDDDYGGEVEVWAEFCKCWARINFGRADERRAAAQEQASLTATFRVRQNAKTRAILMTDRIVYDGANWDITSNVAFDRTGRDITGIRAA
jgi:SPP1 family predicted phage head-tail adaptor